MHIFSIFNKRDFFVWALSILVVGGSFFIGNGSDYFVLIASLLGVTSLIFLAKGHYMGNAIMIVFSILYGVISYYTKYYGEMITYVGMTLPMAVLALKSWMQNPFKDKKTQVAIATISVKDIVKIAFITIAVTIVFYFILKFIGTASLFVSTLSIATSFFAASLTYKRSELYALAYAVNDLVLIILWVVASFGDPTYITMASCFLMFFINDIYGYFSWIKMKKHQNKVSQT